MPPRLPRHVLFSLALALTGQAVAGDLNWMTKQEMDQLPPQKQKPVPAWCGGIYYNPSLEPDPKPGDTVITAKESSMMPEGLAKLIGDVKVEQPGRRLHADRAMFNQKTGDFDLTGHIHVETPDLTFNAKDMKGNSHNRIATLNDAEYALFPQHARGKAKTIHENGDKVNIRQGSYTTCEPGNAGWQLNASHIHLDRASGWGEASNVVLDVYHVPVAYIPWITFPIDNRRKTGLLFPSIASSDAGGVDITQPLYLNLNPQFDATIAPRHIHGRGNGAENEFRYLNTLGEGSLSYAFIHNDRKFNGQDRSLARWKHDGAIDNWILKADVNYVSDDYYFKDLGTGLQVTSQTNLPRTGSARYLGKTWDLLLRAQSWQTIDPTLPASQYPYRRLPQVQLQGDPKLIGPLHLLWFSDYTRFDRDVSPGTPNTVGKRSHLQPALDLDLRRPWGYVDPRVRLYYTSYALDSNVTLPDDNPERTVVGGSVDSGLYIERSLKFGGTNWRQTLEPRLFYNHVGYQPQASLPVFDAAAPTFSYETLFRENRFNGYDRIGDEEEIATGLTSRLINDDTGSELLRLRVGQAFYLRPRRVQLDGQPVDHSDVSPLVADASYRLSDHLNAFAETQWNTDIGRKQADSLRLNYQDDNRRFLNAGYYLRQVDTNGPRIRQGEAGAMWPVSDRWSLIGRWLYDMDNGRSLETMSGVEYRNCCWKVRLLNDRELSDRNGDSQLQASHTILLQIQLIGLGGFGGRVDSLLEDSFPGYRP